VTPAELDKKMYPTPLLPLLKLLTAGGRIMDFIGQQIKIRHGDLLPRPASPI
jgi:hypothetical protein